MVFVTAKANTKELQRFIELGAVDVIAKPLDPMKLGDQVRKIGRQRMADELSREEKLASMARRFVDRAREQAARIAELRVLVAREQGKGDTLPELRRLIHSLHGSAGTFGFGEISVAAGIAEDLCDGLLESDGAPIASRFADLDRAVDKLLAQIAQID